MPNSTLNKELFYLFLLFSIRSVAVAQPINAINTCHAVLKDSTLVLENNRMSRTYRWNNGNLISTGITDKTTNHTWPLNGNTPDCVPPGTGTATKRKAGNRIYPAQRHFAGLPGGHSYCNTWQPWNETGIPYLSGLPGYSVRLLFKGKCKCQMVVR